MAADASWRGFDDVLSLGSAELLPTPPRTAPFGALDIRATVALLQRNAALIAAAFGLTLGIAILVTLLTPPRYVATAEVQIDQEADRVLAERASVQPEIAVQDADRFLNTQLAVIRSRRLALRVVQTLQLAGDDDFFRIMRADPPSTPAGRIDRAAQLVLDARSITLPRESRVAVIGFASSDAQLSARIANGYVRAYVDGNLQRKVDATAYARDYVSRELTAARDRLEGAERAVADYARAAGLVGVGAAIGAAPGEPSADGSMRTGQSVTGASLAQLNAAALAARADRIAAQGRWRVAAGAAPFTIPEVLGNPAIQQLTQQRATAEAALQQESAKHLDDHPTVQQARALVGEIDAQRTALATEIRQSLDQSYRAALAREAALDRQVTSFRSATLAEQARGVRYGILLREAQTSRGLYEALLQRHRQLGLAAGVSTNNVSIVDDAIAPAMPETPRPALNLALALLAGLALAAAFVTAREQLDDTIRAPDEVERKLRLPLLGVVPRVEAADHGFDGPAAIDAYQSVRTALSYASPHGAPRCIVVTSAIMGEGKSTSALALAQAFAGAGRRVVLVGGDLRRPAIEQLAGVPNDRGLSDGLIGAGTQTLVRPLAEWGGEPNLWVLPAGPCPPRPAALLGLPRLRAVIDKLRARFDVVIVDAPPVLGPPDAALWAAIGDATVLIVAAQRGAGGQTRAALRRLRAVRADVVGAVLTKLDLHGAAGSAGPDHVARGWRRWRSTGAW